MVQPEQFKKGKHVYTKWDKNFKEVRVVNENNAAVPNEPKLNVELDDVVAQGMYSNLASITHNENEFIFDFIFVQPQVPKARVRARIIVSPAHAKRFLEALAKNVSSYEAKTKPIQQTNA